MQRRSFLASLLLALFCPWKTATKAATVAIKPGIYLVEKDVSFYPYIYAPYIPFYRTPAVVLDDLVARKAMADRWSRRQREQGAASLHLSRRSRLHSFAQKQRGQAERLKHWRNRKVNSRYYHSAMVAYPKSQWLLPR